jgi:putative aldouronate transport system permease protein
MKQRFSFDSLSKGVQRLDTTIRGIRQNGWARARKTLRTMWKDYLLYVMLIPGLVYFILFKYWPMYGITIAFRDYSIYKGFEDAPWVGLDHFISLFTKAGFIRALYNNIIISLQKLVFGFPVPILLSLLINEVRSRSYKRFVQTAVILPNFVSWVVIYGLMFAMFSTNSGALKGVLTMFGYKGPIPNILGNKETFRLVILISHIWKGAGMGTIVYLAAISGIDPQLYEAAIIDGAGKLARTWHITLGSIRTTIVILLIFRVGEIMNAGFDQIFAISNSLVVSVADIIDTYTYRLGLVQRDYSVATAAGLFKSLVGLILVLLTNYTAKKIDEESGIM